MAKPSPTLSPKVLTARRRRRLYDERQARHEKVYQVPLNLDRIERLIDAGLLAEHDALDRKRVADAITQAIDLLDTRERLARA